MKNTHSLSLSSTLLLLPLLLQTFVLQTSAAAEPQGEHLQHEHGQIENGDKLFNARPAPLTATADKSSQNMGKVKYVCPMHPHVISETPATCPICGMNLEQVTLGAAAEEIVVGVSGGMQQALGMRSQMVKKGSLYRFVKTIGTVEYNQDAISHMHTRITGWVETVKVHNMGQKVAKGQLMYELYSPELINAQDDYMQALDYFKQDKKRGAILKQKARQRLALLGVADHLITQLETSGNTIYKMPFYAPQDGIVSQLALREGMYIQPGSTLVELVDIATVWVIADVFENEQSWLDVGRGAEVTAAAQGLFDLPTSIDYIYPELDTVTRAMRVRLKLNNPNELLRPGTLVDVSLFGGPKHNVITIPTEALILTGRENRVVVQREATGFSSITVKVGILSQGQAEIIEGLKEGDHVVVSGQFLLDSEASIQGSLQRLSGNTPAGAQPDVQPDPHAGHGR
ncbi:efflux RND transporter periplasmic adaptor subunit [Shewanella sp. SR44-3]|uniref:efflux RND transporter periplasmic adaptor subunit n=1 Tax=Shewanella sp. SR44-3 TaxID=2760936 RepID=UPI0015F99420|nr:efflux RND transporter periplasmic adaptor subunit [Shewanella sp. SR44-3]MBB1268517.1 efflux RND transporter periplasmic adaptor subunit [Shewanella sp. SR44-3]